MFQSYNEKACQFECRLKFAARQAGCIPWDYPVPQRSAGGDDLDWGALEICRSNHSGENGENRLSVFERAMDSDAALRQSGCDDCSPNCEEVTFETQVNTLELDVEGLCDRNGDWRSIDRVMRDWQRVSSTAAHWAGEISPANYRRWFETMKLDKWTALGVTNFSYGLPTDDAIKMCKKVISSRDIFIALLPGLEPCRYTNSMWRRSWCRLPNRSSFRSRRECVSRFRISWQSSVISSQISSASNHYGKMLILIYF